MRASRRNPSQSAGRPKTSTARIALVRGVTACAARRHLQVEGVGFDVHEHGFGPLVKQTVGGGDEAEGGGNHLVPLPDSERAHEEMERAGTGVDRDRVANPDVLGHALLELTSFGPSESRRVRSTSTTAVISSSATSGADSSTS